MSQPYPKSLGAGSDKYGPCEVCGGKMDTAYISWLEYPSKGLFSHKSCAVYPQKQEKKS